MRTAFILAAAYVLAIGAAAPQAARADEPACRLLLATGLRTQSDVAGRPLIPVRIDGREKLFLIDTGGVSTMLTHEAARELNLSAAPVAPRSFIFVNGDDAKATARARSFTIGRLPLGEFTFLVTPRSLRIPGAAGALGPDIMRFFDVEFDFARDRFNLFAQSQCEGGVVYWTRRPHAKMNFTLDDEGHITAVAVLDGKLVDILIDTGAVATTMLMEDAISEFGVTPASRGMELIDDGGGNERNAVYRYRFGTLDLEGITIQRPGIIIRPDRTGLHQAGLRPELILGMRELSKLHLYVAYRERRIYVTGSGDR